VKKNSRIATFKAKILYPSIKWILSVN